MTKTIIGFIVVSASLAAQDIHLKLNWDKLLPKAVESVDVNLDGAMLQMASKFLGEKGDEAQAKKLISGLKGVYVRSLKFANAGEYSMSDVDSIRNQLRSPAWSRIVDVRSSNGGDNAGVYIKSDGKEIQGLVVVAAEPKELTVVNIVGSIDPESVRQLGGKFGIPKMDLDMTRPKPKKDD